MKLSSGINRQAPCLIFHFCAVKTENRPQPLRMPSIISEPVQYKVKIACLNSRRDSFRYHQNNISVLQKEAFNASFCNTETCSVHT